MHEYICMEALRQFTANSWSPVTWDDRLAGRVTADRLLCLHKHHNAEAMECTVV